LKTAEGTAKVVNFAYVNSSAMIAWARKTLRFSPKHNQQYKEGKRMMTAEIVLDTKKNIDGQMEQMFVIIIRDTDHRDVAFIKADSLSVSQLVMQQLLYCVEACGNG